MQLVHTETLVQVAQKFAFPHGVQTGFAASDSSRK
jgi:hypothetical protein